jgi:hypothetical protein
MAAIVQNWRKMDGPAQSGGAVTRGVSALGLVGGSTAAHKPALAGVEAVRWGWRYDVGASPSRVHHW